MLMSTGMRLRPFSRMRTTVHSKPWSLISAEHPRNLGQEAATLDLKYVLQ